MGLARGDILPVKVAVEIDRGVDLLHDRIGFRPEASAPHFVAHDDASAEVQIVTEQSVPPRRRLARLRLLAAAAAAAMLAVLAGVYGIGGLRSNPDAAACADAVKTAGRIAPLARGEV